MNRIVALSLIALVSTLPAAAQDVAEGQGLFQNHCATCHGVDATGNGPMAPALTLQPTDLTGLAARNDGVFPTARVVMRIDGREPLVSHGSPMPVFGRFFETVESVALKTPAGQPILTSQPIVDLVTWIQSVQE